uniref:C3H1-type domain-containing protein n=1 Tax=Culex tarsalis TaxID=7177 RepID=A0A1Q3F3X1_CULTA
MDETTEPRAKIFINPNFKKAHINRNFLPQPTAIQSVPVPEEVSATGPSAVPRVHFNPAFLEKLHRQREQQEELLLREMTLTQRPAEATVVPPRPPPNPIIKHTMRKLIRASSSVPVPVPAGPRPPLLAPLVKISKNKLVRSAPIPMVASNKPASYKLDRRPGVLSRAVPKVSSIRRYSLVRTNSISPRKVVITDRRLLKLRRTKSAGKSSAARTLPSISFASPNKKLVMLNINGVLYRSSSNKLQVQPSSSASSGPQGVVALRSAERSLTIRGTRFLLDSSGTKLRKMPSMTEDDGEARLGRIDIGGLTYKPGKDGTFVRTDVHRTRTYLSLAKHKSIQVLTNKLRKCNIPCQIYRRLGKCSAQLKGKCPRLHDPKHVVICPRFLKGECTLADRCLLSHDVSLEKMPVCRFFLEGRCVKNDCPYLHKKVSETERICEDFLRGYCPLAAMCQRRHEFVCPEFDRLGVCDRSKCPYPHGSRREERRSKPVESVSKKVESSQVLPSPMKRYYLDREVEATGERDELSDEQKLQLKRLLGKVEKMKQGHGEDGGEKISSASEVGEVMENNSGVEEDESDDDEDPRSPVMKRAKLGPLPSFIPI